MEKQTYEKPKVNVLKVETEDIMTHSGWLPYNGRGWDVMNLRREDGGYSGILNDGTKVWSPTGGRNSRDWLYYPEDDLE